VARYASATRGQLQQLQKEASTFCGMVMIIVEYEYNFNKGNQATSFCRKLNWHHLASIFEAYAGRLSYGVCEELLPLVKLGPQVYNDYAILAFVKISNYKISLCHLSVQEFFTNMDSRNLQIF
jgi:hypothetical protein